MSAPITTRDIAYAILALHEHEKVADVYDIPAVAAAIYILMPAFEYPDWAHRKVSHLLRTRT